MGDNTGCYGNFACGRIKVAAGCHLGTCNIERFDDKNAYYLVNHPDLRWTRATIKSQQSTDGLVIDSKDVFTLKFARVVDIWNGKRYTTIGSNINNATTGGTGLTVYHSYGTRKEEVATDIEILTCLTPSLQSTSICRTLNSGEVLTINDKLCHGNSEMYLRSDGNLVIKTNSNVIWSTNTAGSGAIRVFMQPDGSLVLFTAVGEVVWSSANFSTLIWGSDAKLTSNGELQITYNGKISWRSASHI